mmetsp:Transcript_10646/g.12806  ORF Transcript_10646/g.12806 Transcript_10646/m.12806 type:complete len:143 (+) Transcript_10646:47-475(+)|eukprot:CAMPEP_0195265930 /NCGR_PEP_ID=MMETSP0706-20130129/11715_1 /TAXON_ID=33640 /ORGANISM="Asterionellopsis glacialis, Strain CCMP134" /LENGTH=142 /DNA_ID=CAMNT_0040320439 /DNA_START=40 /DNA_END=468 /DNA_ORIENTATION=-
MYGYCHGFHHGHGCHHGHPHCHRHNNLLFPSGYGPCTHAGCGSCDGLYLPVNLPGFRHENLDVQLDDNTLTVSALCHHCHCNEPSKFIRHFDINSAEVDVSKLKADLTDDGVLVVQAPRKAQGEGSSIPINKKDCTEAKEDK